MNTKRILIAAGAAFALGMLIGPHVIHAQDDHNDGIHNQLRIMTKILEASIGKDSIDRQLHSSVFDSKIRAEYIPTVGAIFTIPISFPLHPSQDEGGDEPEEALEDDLWEHFSNANENPSSAATPTPSPEEQLLNTVRKYGDYLGNDPSDEQRLKRIASYMGEIPLLGVLKRGVFNHSIGDSKRYDPVKVSTLTHTIIQTIAQYGHRLKSLQNSERILVVLEAPGPRGSAVISGVSNDKLGGFFFRQKPTPGPLDLPKAVELYVGADEDAKSSAQKKNVKPWSDIIIEREKRKRSGEPLNAFHRSPRAQVTVVTEFLSEEHYDRRLLAFKKSDLQQECSYDSIEGKVETTDY